MIAFLSVFILAASGGRVQGSSSLRPRRPSARLKLESAVPLAAGSVLWH